MTPRPGLLRGSKIKNYKGSNALRVTWSPPPGFSNSSLNSNRKLKYFSVEVITFDGESYTEEVEARNAEEAQEIAASLHDEVDYTMVQGCFVGW